MTSLAGKTILVVGATAGIGAEIWRLAAAAGASVIGAGRNRAAGERIVSSVDGEFIQADVSRIEDVDELFDVLRQRGRPLDGAVNNAAVTQVAEPIDQMRAEDFDRLVSINLRGAWLCVAREMRMMRERGGAIVNVASIAGKRGFPGLSAYCATKHGVIGITRSAALDGASSGIRVNALLPGTTRTEMMEEQMRTRPGGLEGTIARIPLGRISNSSEQARAALWLLSDESSFVTGECLTVDGGTTTKC